jgi:4-oxalocrotonate tautomerase family enzyme
MERKRTLVHEISRAVADAYGTPPEHITVLIREYGPESFAVGGQLLLDRRRGPAPAAPNCPD